MIKLIAALAMVLTLTSAAIADTRGTPTEAQALVQRATQLIQKEGADKAFAQIKDAAGPFMDRDLYVFVLDFQGVSLARPDKPAMIGKTLIDLRDPDGKLYIQEMIALAKDRGEGWVDYKTTNPTTKKIEPKSSFVKRVGDYVVGVGVYKE